jgi:hypothetical protein
MKAEKSNVIQFPTERRKAEVEEERMDVMLQNEDDAINVSHYIMDLIQSALDELSVEYPDLNIDMADTDDVNYKDFMVILNMLVSLFFRRAGMDHILHEDLESSYEKLAALVAFRLEDYQLTVEDIDDEDDIT